MNTITGDIWSVPYMPRDQWMDHPRIVWEEAELVVIEAGYGGKVKQAREICGVDSIDPSIRGRFSRGVAEMADDLGAPVGQAFTVAVLRTRRER